MGLTLMYFSILHFFPHGEIIVSSFRGKTIILGVNVSFYPLLMSLLVTAKMEFPTQSPTCDCEKHILKRYVKM